MHFIFFLSFHLHSFFELTTTGVIGWSTTNYATEMSKKIPNLINIYSRTGPDKTIWYFTGITDIFQWADILSHQWSGVRISFMTNNLFMWILLNYLYRHYMITIIIFYLYNLWEIFQQHFLLDIKLYNYYNNIKYCLFQMPSSG